MDWVKSIFGSDCDELQANPNADPLEKEFCSSFMQFTDMMSAFDPTIRNEPVLSQPDEPDLREDRTHSTPGKPDAQLLRDSILNKTPSVIEREPFGMKLAPDQDLDTMDLESLKEFMSSDSSPDEVAALNSTWTYSHTVTTIDKDGKYHQKFTYHDSNGNTKVTVKDS